MTPAPAPGARTAPDPAAHFAYLVGLMPDQLARLGWDESRIAQEQTAALRSLLAHAREHSAWHRERLKGLDLDSITAADLHSIAPMTKADLMDNWDQIVTVPGVTLEQVERFLGQLESFSYFGTDMVALASGGTSGRNGAFLFDWHGWAMNRAAVLRSAIPLIVPYGAPSTVRSASVSANAPTHFSCLMAQCFAPPGNAPVRLPIALPLSEIVDGLNRCDPVVLHCFASYLRVLADEALAGRLTIRPKLIFCTSEPLPRDDAALARQVWGATVLSSWSASETIGTTPCAASDGCHVAEDLNVIEPFDARGRPAAPGTTADHVLVTNLYNRALPIIRYRIDDRFEFATGRCPCGSAYKKVERVHGRTYEIFRYPGAAVHPEILETPILALPRLAEYQIAQTARGVHVSIVSARQVDVAALQTALAELLVRLGISEPEVRVTMLDEVPRTMNGKLKRYVPLPDLTASPM